jgi:hypothetical protein
VSGGRLPRRTAPAGACFPLSPAVQEIAAMGPALPGLALVLRQQIAEGRVMRSAIRISVWVLVLPALAVAQGADRRHGWVYSLAGPAAFSQGGPAVFNAAGGGEILLGSGLAVGGELGYLAHRDGIGLASVDVSYHSGGHDAGRRLVPFITGGGSAAFRSKGGAGGGNIGGGIQYWVHRRMALRLEIRDFIFSSDSPHLVAFRVGITFR